MTPNKFKKCMYVCMLVHRRFTSQQYVAGTHLYTRVKRDKVE